MRKSTALETLKKTLAVPQSNPEDERGVGGDESVSEAVSKNVFASYKPSCSAIDRGIIHPGDIAEATSLSAIKLPETTYPLWDSIPAGVIDSGKLSQLQLEGIICACTKHLQFLPNGERAGFFLGDGAGVGKGRQIAGVILDNYARGRRRAVWLSTSSDLHHDAQRDLRALGCHIAVINNCQELDRETRVVGLAKDKQEGVLFMTYSTLISQHKKQTRLQQVLDWVGGASFDGCLVFDESHKSKNFTPGKEAQSTKVATAVLELQEKLPRARVLYCSATGVSEVGNMAYMGRLGLWGLGTSFTDFSAFLDSMKSRGVSFLEMLAMEMKSEGYYLARSLSFRDAEFTELECKLTAQQISMYDGAVLLWQDLRTALVTALELTGSKSREVWKPYWSAQQRFFKLLCISIKVPTVVREARAALQAGHAVVVGLQSTGEAAADALGLEPGQACGFVSTTREMLSRFVTSHFPTQYEPSTDAVVKPDMVGKSHPVCLAAKQALLERVAAADLPPNFLDELIDELGGPNACAEMTGRRGRVARNKSGKAVFQLRAKPDSSEMDSLNVKETASFMQGTKLVAIVSDAASTGISLHASAEAANQRRRVHMTIELPWSADRAIQQLGRSHRSNQVSAPMYKLVLTSLGGEKRFASAVARRLQSLGALTRGDRRAASGIDLSDSNLDNPLGAKSLRRMYDLIVQEAPRLPTGVNLATLLEASGESDSTTVLQMLPGEGRVSEADLAAAVQRLHGLLRESVSVMAVGVTLPRGDTAAPDDNGSSTRLALKELGDVRRFLNRLLGMPVARQALLFNYFFLTLTAEIQSAKSEGRYFEGVSDLSGSNITMAGEPQVLWVDALSHRPTLRHSVTVDRGMPFEVAQRRLAHQRTGPSDASGFRRSRRPMFGRDMVLLATQKPGSPGLFDIARPNTGASFFDMEADELSSKYSRISEEQAQELWTELYNVSGAACMHGVNCQLGPDCQVGRRKTSVTVLAGSVVRVWGALEATLSRNEHSLSKSDRTMRSLHVTFADGSALIGIRYPAKLLAEVVATLGAAKALLADRGQAQGEGGAPKGGALAPHSTSQAAKQAAAMSANLQKHTDPVSPVHAPSLQKAFRAPRTVLDFFRPTAKQATIGEVICMGFSREQAVSALRATGGDVQRAINWLLEQAGQSVG
ncbi:hypothetical protein WJX73_007295 [Symbiochloris irregularis]|uniref:UBA domain-containing protein n=1 Tax=Symbiochloris irregularis TaxID=706552 RepID=A0AAW1NX58_9CHLO